VTLRVNDLVVRYGKLQALHGVTLTVEEGQFVAVLGCNGAGKTTLVHTIAGLLCPYAGTIHLDGARISGRSPSAIVRHGIAVVPEGRQLFGKLSVADNLRLGAYGRVAGGPLGLMRALLPRVGGVEERVDRVVTLLPELRVLLGRRSGSLSGGQQQMVAVGRALMADPKVLIVDELSLGLAPLVVERLLEHLSGLHAGGISVVLIEQNIALALRVAEVAYVLEAGVVCFAGPSLELAKSPQVLQAYLGVDEAALA
jgi:branched-chain amino acid transport system ATP-binding protein